MKPILFKENETEFKSNGIGRLSDALSCTVTEARNGEYECELIYPVDGINYKEIRHSRFIYAMPADGKDSQPFQIYKISKPINGRVTINARHISYRMSFIPVLPFTAGSAAAALVGLKNNATEECPFEFWTDIERIATFTVEEPCSMRSKLGGTSGSIIQAYGGEWEFDKMDVKLHEQRGNDNGVTLRYGKNIIDITQEENIQNTYTGILPYWKGKAEEQNTDEIVTLSEKVIHSENAKNFPFNRTIPVDFSSDFDSKPSQEQLRARAQSYIKSNSIGIPKISIKVSFIYLWQTEEYADIANVERVNLCDAVQVEFSKLGVSAKAKVIKTIFNVLTERYDSIEIGEAKSTLGSTIKQETDEIRKELGNYSTQALLNQSIKRATDMITGGLGGYVVLNMNSNNQPEEILVLADSPDYKKAQKVWRWNKNGLGYSSTGYNGTYGTAITKDGHIVADYVDTGTLTANIIRAGVLADVKGNTTWDLTTGELSMLSGYINLGKGNFIVDSNGKLVAKDATVLGSIETKQAYGTSYKRTKIDEGVVKGYFGNTLYGLLDMSAQYEDGKRHVTLKSYDYLHLQAGTRIEVENPVYCSNNDLFVKNMSGEDSRVVASDRNHFIYLSWTGSQLALYVDATPVGYVAFQ